MARPASKGSARPAPAELTAAHGWTLWFHPCVVDQLEQLADAAALAGRVSTATTKLLANLWSLMLDEIPRDPGGSRYRHGGALGDANRHWFRAKTGNGRYRLFFRFDSASRIIIYAWVNDEQSLRTRGAKTDAYAVFAKMLRRGRPPQDWATLLSEARAKRR